MNDTITPASYRCSLHSLGFMLRSVHLTSSQLEHLLLLKESIRAKNSGFTSRALDFGMQVALRMTLRRPLKCIHCRKSISSNGNGYIRLHHDLFAQTKLRSYYKEESNNSQTIHYALEQNLNMGTQSQYQIYINFMFR